MIPCDPRARSLGRQGMGCWLMNAPVKIYTPTQEELAIAMYASLTRVIGQAPIENRLAIFAMMARMAVSELAARRQQHIDDLWNVARDTGLIDVVGVADVQAALSVELERGIR
jgi:hypothetical protein